MKKNYITPEINVIQLEALCDGGFVTASVHKGVPGENVSTSLMWSTRRKSRVLNTKTFWEAIIGAMTDTIVCYRNR